MLLSNEISVSAAVSFDIFPNFLEIPSLASGRPQGNLIVNSSIKFRDCIEVQYLVFHKFCCFDNGILFFVIKTSTTFCQ
jgi:hypothetical protein